MLCPSLSYLCFSCLLNNQEIESYRKENSSYEKNTYSFCCLRACSAIGKKSDKKENQTTLKNDKNTERVSLCKGQASGDEHHNLSKQKDNDEFDSDVAKEKSQITSSLIHRILHEVFLNNTV